jgi:hypothetical protein
MKKWVMRIVLSVLILAVTGGVYFYVAIWRPFRLLYRNETWWNAATTDEQRLVCQRVISHRIGTHDAFLHLARIGNKDSVPLLIRALRGEKLPTDGMTVCTTGHCIGALRSLTGEDFGADYVKWEQWWNTTGHALSPTNFHERVVNRPKDAGR